MIKTLMVDVILIGLALMLLATGLNGLITRRITLRHGAVISLLLRQPHRTATHTGRDAIFWSVITILLGCVMAALAAFPR